MQSVCHVDAERRYGSYIIHCPEFLPSRRVIMVKEQIAQRGDLRADTRARTSVYDTNM